MIFSSRRTEEAMRYLQALQLLVLIIHPAALSAAPLFAAKELDELDGKFAMPDSICIVEIVEAILKHVELEPLRIVLAETFRLTEWGYYIAYYTDRRQALEDLNGRVAASVQYLRAGDAASFADSIADCYRHVLKRAKVYMLENYNFIRRRASASRKNTERFAAPGQRRRRGDKQETAPYMAVKPYKGRFAESKYDGKAGCILLLTFNSSLCGNSH